MSDDLSDDYERVLRSKACPQPDEDPQWTTEVIHRFIHHASDDIQLKVELYGRRGWYVESDTYRDLENMR